MLEAAAFQNGNSPKKFFLYFEINILSGLLGHQPVHKYRLAIGTSDF